MASSGGEGLETEFIAVSLNSIDSTANELINRTCRLEPPQKPLKDRVRGDSQLVNTLGGWEGCTPPPYLTSCIAPVCLFPSCVPYNPSG